LFLEILGIVIVKHLPGKGFFHEVKPGAVFITKEVGMNLGTRPDPFMVRVPVP
jgi:hypothetical protein